MGYLMTTQRNPCVQAAIPCPDHLESFHTIKEMQIGSGVLYGKGRRRKRTKHVALIPKQPTDFFFERYRQKKLDFVAICSNVRHCQIADASDYTKCSNTRSVLILGLSLNQEFVC